MFVSLSLSLSLSLSFSFSFYLSLSLSFEIPGRQVPAASLGAQALQLRAAGEVLVGYTVLYYTRLY